MISVHYILADSDLTQHYPYTFDKTRVMNWIDKSIAVRDWTFINTPFNTVYSYMKKDNIPSAAVAVAYGCKKLDEFIDREMKQLLCTESQGQSGRKLKYNFIQKFT